MAATGLVGRGWCRSARPPARWELLTRVHRGRRGSRRREPGARHRSRGGGTGGRRDAAAVRLCAGREDCGGGRAGDFERTRRDLPQGSGGGPRDPGLARNRDAAQYRRRRRRWISTLSNACSCWLRRLPRSRPPSRSPRVRALYGRARGDGGVFRTDDPAAGPRDRAGCPGLPAGGGNRHRPRDGAGARDRIRRLRGSPAGLVFRVAFWA